MLDETFVRFLHPGETDFRIDERAGGSDIESSADAAAGNDGDDGSPEGKSAPGSGHDGTVGGSSDSVDNTGSELVFGERHPIGTWIETAQTGDGGYGGTGGNAGDINHASHFDHGPWPDGGNGGDGGPAGTATAELASHTIYGFTGSAARDGIALTLVAMGGRGGDGGGGGNGDGENGPVNEPGGNGGNGGTGSTGGSANVSLTDTVFRTTANQADLSVFNISLNLSAAGGNGGSGGFYGAGGVGDTPGSNGSIGRGGYGGAAHITIDHDTFLLKGAAGSTSTLTLTAYAEGGNNRANDFGGGAHVALTNDAITGGAENDIVRISLGSYSGGIEGDVGFMSLEGTTIHGGGGANSLEIGWDYGPSTILTVDVNAGTITAPNGTSATFKQFQSITIHQVNGAFIGDDRANVFIGDGSSDTFTGAGGADTLTGSGGVNTFVYHLVQESTSNRHDTITNFDFDRDNIDLDAAPFAIDQSIGGATIHSGSFDHDLIVATRTHLNPHDAMLVDVAHGDLKGHTFLLIDMNGTRGYQAGSDFVIDITGAANVADFSLDTFT